MAQESKLRPGRTCRLTTEAPRTTGEERAEEIFPPGTKVAILQVRPWIQVEALGKNDQRTGKKFAVTLDQIDDGEEDSPTQQLMAAA